MRSRPARPHRRAASTPLGQKRSERDRVGPFARSVFPRSTHWKLDKRWPRCREMHPADPAIHRPKKRPCPCARLFCVSRSRLPARPSRAGCWPLRRFRPKSWDRPVRRSRTRWCFSAPACPARSPPDMRRRPHRSSSAIASFVSVPDRGPDRGGGPFSRTRIRSATTCIRSLQTQEIRNQAVRGATPPNRSCFDKPGRRDDGAAMCTTGLLGYLFVVDTALVSARPTRAV